MDIKTWLREIGMGEYWEKFEANKIDENTLKEMTEDDLKDIGIEALGDRKKIVSAVSEKVSKEESDRLYQLEMEAQSSDNHSSEVFIKYNLDYATRYTQVEESPTKESEQSKIREERKNRNISFFSDLPRFYGWNGTIKNVSDDSISINLRNNEEVPIIFSVKIDNDDIKEHTSAAKNGQKVVFGARVELNDDDDGIEEGSFTESGGMREPEYQATLESIVFDDEIEKEIKEKKKKKKDQQDNVDRAKKKLVTMSLWFASVISILISGVTLTEDNPDFVVSILIFFLGASIFPPFYRRFFHYLETTLDKHFPIKIKSLLPITILLLIVISVPPIDYYAQGISQFEVGRYDEALKSFQAVDIDNERYDEAQIYIAQIKKKILEIDKHRNAQFIEYTMVYVNSYKNELADKIKVERKNKNLSLFRDNNEITQWSGQIKEKNSHDIHIQLRKEDQILPIIFILDIDDNMKEKVNPFDDNQYVYFGAQLDIDTGYEDGIKEDSITDMGSITEPEYIGRLTNLSIDENLEPKRQQRAKVEEENRKKELASIRIIAEAKYPCQKAVESNARWSHEWTDELLESKFHCYTSDDMSYVVCTGDKVKFQNGFGSWSNMNYRCRYDATKDEVESIEVW